MALKRSKVLTMKIDGKEVPIVPFSNSFADKPSGSADAKDGPEAPVTDGPDGPSPKDGEDAVEEDKQEKLRIRRNIDSMKRAKVEQAVADLKDDMIREKYHVRFMRSLERNRRNDIDAAVSHYGENADLEGIQYRYDVARDKATGRINGPLGDISMMINNAMMASTGKEAIELAEGGTRVLNKTTAEAIAFERDPIRKLLTPAGTLFVALGEDPDDLSDDTDLQDGAPDSVKELAPEKADEVKEQIDALETVFLNDLHYFEHRLSRNVVEEHRLRYAYPYSGYMSPKDFRDHIHLERQRAMEEEKRREAIQPRLLPAVAAEYAYIFRNIELMMEDLPEGRRLPETMYSPQVQTQLSMQGGLEGRVYVPKQGRQNQYEDENQL